MARFKVELAQTVIERASVWTEANSEDEAAKLIKRGIMGSCHKVSRQILAAVRRGVFVPLQ